MMSVSELPVRQSALPQGQVLKGQYVGAFRSEKGKLKGLWLQSGTTTCKVELPKYLRPMLLRELQPENWIQVWAYPEAGGWRAVNILPLPSQEIEGLRLSQPSLGEVKPPQPAGPCLQVCRKGTCYKRGSGEVWQQLQQEIDANPEFQGVTLEATGCLKACKQGPNVRLPSGQTVSLARPSMAKALLQKVVGDR